MNPRRQIWMLGSALALGIVGLTAAATEPVSAPTDGATWMTDYPAARAVAARTGKPLFVVFR